MNVTNLNQFRKEKTRAEKKAQADENAVKFGLSKAEKLLNAAREEKARKALDQQQFEDE